MQNLNSLTVAGKRVLVRVDYNVPIKNGVIQDDTRIRPRCRPSTHCWKAAQSLVLMSHLGRPKGGPEPKYSLAPLVDALSRALGRPVQVYRQLSRAAPRRCAAVQTLQPGEVALLENVRFEAGEEKNDPALVEKLAQLGDAFVLDAFGSAHRAHASVSGVASKLPHAAGTLLQTEVDALEKLINNPAHPYVVIIGGAKVSDKLKVIENLLPKVDRLLIGGGMAYTFIKSRGGMIGESIHEDDQLGLAQRLLAEYGKARSCCRPT